MKKKFFEELLESVRQGGDILQGTARPSRTFRCPSKARCNPPETGWAICVKTDDPSLLIPNKIYRVWFLEEAVRVVDEEGWPTIYPNDYFLPVEFPPEIERKLSAQKTD